MRTGRPVARIELSAEIAGILEGYAQRRKTAQALALRARHDLCNESLIQDTSEPAAGLACALQLTATAHQDYCSFV
jgi:hypothetical protein